MGHVTSPAFPVVKIEGPPGSGKTRELAREACRLIAQDGYTAGQMVLLAATPLGRERLQAELGQEAKLAGLAGPFSKVLTLEHWLLGLLKEGVSKSGPEPMLLRDAEAQVLLQAVLRQVAPIGEPLHYALRQGSASRLFLGLIQQLQLKGLSAAAVSQEIEKSSSQEPRLQLLASVYQQFEAKLRAGNLLCYAELVHRAFELLDHSPELLSRLRSQIAVILLDEAQELSSAMYRLLALLGCRLVLAGNEKLSIRSFQGAEPGEFVTLRAYAAARAEVQSSPLVTYISRQACWRGNESILTLLNSLLPKSIWESQAVDVEQLAQSIQFGYFADPQQEAERVAERIASFVDTEMIVPGVGDDTTAQRPAQWSDCVVLLRSYYYRQHLLQAFLERGIPYRYDSLSEETIRLQHGIYDLLKVLSEWQGIHLDSELLKDAEGLQRFWMAQFVSALEQEQWTAENNRHLLRCLETLFLGDGQVAGLRHVSTGQDATGWLLPDLCQLNSLPPDLVPAIAELFALYARVAAEDSAIALIAALQEILLAHWAGEPGFTGLLAGLDVFRQNLMRLDAYYQASFSRPLSVKEALESFQNLWDGAETDNGAMESSKGNQVRILGFHQVQGEESPLVVVPFMVSGEFPYTRELPELLPPEAQSVLGIAGGYQLDAAEEARLLAVGLSRASQRVVLSGHSQQGNELIPPSSFYMTLLQAKRNLLGLPVMVGLCGCIAGEAQDLAHCCVDFCRANNELNPIPEASGLDDAMTRYTGTSDWAKLSRQESEALFEPQETLTISASSIKTFMQCPRQFYYKHLLRLPQPSSDVAALGTLIHRVMEVFNRQAGKIPYNAASLARIAEGMFCFDTDEDTFLAAGFEPRDKQSLSRLSPLGLSQLRQRLLASIEDLSEKGYFDRYGSLRRIYPERTLEGIALPGIDRVRFRGAMDAVIELADGSVEILDYKTFRSAYGAGLDTCDKRFLETLEPLPDDEELTHGERFGDKLSAAYPTDYQLPLYYMACQQDPEIGRKLSAVALQIIRPAFPENPHQGAIRLVLNAAQIEAQKARIIEDINHYIVIPMMESEAFEPNPSPMGCSGCAYYGICEAGDESGLSEDGEA